MKLETQLLIIFILELLLMLAGIIFIAIELVSIGCIIGVIMLIIFIIGAYKYCKNTL